MADVGAGFAVDAQHISEQEKLRAEIQGIYLSYERAFAEKHGHEFGPRAHDEKDNDPPHLETRGAWVCAHENCCQCY